MVLGLDTRGVWGIIVSSAGVIPNLSLVDYGLFSHKTDQRTDRWGYSLDFNQFSFHDKSGGHCFLAASCTNKFGNYHE
jgi:hypothetical protein